MKVCMFVKNGFVYDARVRKEAVTLTKTGYQVIVVALHYRGLPRSELDPAGFEVIRVFRSPVVAEKVKAWIEQGRDRARRMADPGPRPSRSEDTDEASTQTASLSTTNPYPRTPARKSSLRWLRKLASRLSKAGWWLINLVAHQGRWLKEVLSNRQMVRAGLEIAADIYHCHDVNTLAVGVRCQKRTGAKLVYDTHELATERNQMGWWWRRREIRNERRGLAATDGLIVASPSWLPFLQQLYQRIPELNTTILNVPPLTVVTPRSLHQELNIPEHSPILIYQGTIQHNRGIEPAIEAIELLADLDAVLLVIGFGYYLPTLRELVTRRVLDKQVRLLGPVPNEELLEWTAGASLGLCNIINSSLSYYTALPNKLFEYFMAGIPVLGSDSPEIGRIVQATGAGEVVDPESPQSLADAARQILTDPEPYRLRARAAARIYNWEAESKKLLDFYRHL